MIRAGCGSGLCFVVCGGREADEPGPVALDPAEQGAGAAVDVPVPGLAVLEDVEGLGFGSGQAEE